MRNQRAQFENEYADRPQVPSPNFLQTSGQKPLMSRSGQDLLSEIPGTKQTPPREPSYNPLEPDLQDLAGPESTFARNQQL